MVAGWTEQVSDLDARLDRVMRDPTAQPRRDVEELERRLDRATREKVVREQRNILNYESRLTALGPMHVLDRGFSFVQAESGSDIGTATEALEHDTVTIHFADGSVRVNIIERVGK